MRLKSWICVAAVLLFSYMRLANVVSVPCRDANSSIFDSAALVHGNLSVFKADGGGAEKAAYRLGITQKTGKFSDCGTLSFVC